MAEKILITIDRELFDKYRKVYFKERPRAKKFPFDTKGKTKKTRYSVLSLNDMLPITSLAYGDLKGKWGDFGVWCAKHYGLSDKQLTNSMFELRVFSETKAQKDCSNVAGGYKILEDGMCVQSGFMVDDSYLHINPLLIVCDYDKVNPRLEIRVTLFEDADSKDVYYRTEEHINAWR
jgi:hypothetical protein